MTETELYQLLSTDPGIIAASTEVINGELQENTALPAVTFAYVSDRPINTLKGDTGHAYNRYSISVWAHTGAECDALEAAVKQVMRSHHRIGRIRLDELNNPDLRIYRVALDYSLFG